MLAQVAAAPLITEQISQRGDAARECPSVVEARVGACTENRHDTGSVATQGAGSPQQVAVYLDRVNTYHPAQLGTKHLGRTAHTTGPIEKDFGHAFDRQLFQHLTGEETSYLIFAQKVRIETCGTKRAFDTLFTNQQPLGFGRPAIGNQYHKSGICNPPQVNDFFRNIGVCRGRNHR